MEAVNEVAAAGLAILLVFIWCGLIRFAGRFRPARWQSIMVWCARMKCISLIEAEPVANKERKSAAVCHCLLWPELHDCDQRCIH